MQSAVIVSGCDETSVHKETAGSHEASQVHCPQRTRSRTRRMPLKQLDVSGVTVMAGWWTWTTGEPKAILAGHRV